MFFSKICSRKGSFQAFLKKCPGFPPPLAKIVDMALGISMYDYGANFLLCGWGIIFWRGGGS